MAARARGIPGDRGRQPDRERGYRGLVREGAWPYRRCSPGQENQPCPAPRPSSPSSAGPASSGATSPSAWRGPAGGCGWRCAGPNEADFVRPYGVVGQVEPIQANIRDEASTRRGDRRRGRGGQLRRRPGRERPADLRRGGRRTAPAGSRASPPRRASRGWCTSRRSAPTRTSDSLYAARQGPRRGRGARRLSRRGDPAAVDRLRHRGPASSTASRRWRGCRRSCRWSAPRPASSRSTSTTSRPPRRRRRPATAAPGVYELGGPGGRDLPRADGADARDHPAPAAGRGAAARARAAAGVGCSTSCSALSCGLFTNAVADPRPGAAARPRQRGDARARRASPTSASSRRAMEAVLESYLYAYRPHGPVRPRSRNPPLRMRT